MQSQLNEQVENLYFKLVDSLEGLIKVYRGLLEVVRHEREILVEAKLDDLNENNKTKEKLLHQSRALEQIRIKCVKDISDYLGLKEVDLRLKDLALQFDYDKAEKLRNINAVLELLIKRVQEHNKQNEALVDSALRSITGAMNTLKETLQDKKAVYQSQGEMKTAGSSAGHLVSRQA
jgi:flagellar biosynthesis/type III secretory pathway chaperone